MVKHCENEECGKAFIAARRDRRFCGASCRAREHTLKARRASGRLGPRAVVVADGAQGAKIGGGEVLERGLGSGRVSGSRLSRLEHQVVALALAVEQARTDGVRGLDAVTAELRVGQARGDEAVARLQARIAGAEAVRERKARSAAREAHRLELRLSTIEARQGQVIEALLLHGQRLTAIEQALLAVLSQLGVGRG